MYDVHKWFKNFCKALRAHNTQSNNKVVKINSFTTNYPMHYGVIKQITFSGRPCVTNGNDEYYYTLTHSQYIDNYKPFKLFNSEKLYNQF